MDTPQATTWLKRNGAPFSVADVAQRFKAYQTKHPAWGSLHIVLDDKNVEDEHVWFCVQFAKERGDVEGALLARVLMAMTKTQRLKLGGIGT